MCSWVKDQQRASRTCQVYSRSTWLVNVPVEVLSTETDDSMSGMSEMFLCALHVLVQHVNVILQQWVAAQLSLCLVLDLFNLELL